MFNWRNKKIILGVLAVAVGIGLFFGIAVADDLTVLHEVLNPDYGTAASQTKEIGTIVTVITTILSWALSVVAGLVDFALNLGNSVLKLDVVTIGWRIVLNFTNLGFVLAIIIIAFATIFRLENYAMKQVLWKLIVAALLVNFSLVIAGAFISASITVTNTFLEATTFDSLSNALGNAMEPQKFVEVKDPTLWQFIKGAFSYFLKFIFSLLFVAVFTFLTILVFLTLFLMLLVRAIALALLLILSPIVWLLWIFPATNKYWQQWWQEFIRWNVFAPAVLFFVYLTVIASTKLGELKSIKVGDIAAIEAAKEQLMLGNEAIQHGANLFVLLGILFGGIYVANKFGIAGGGVGIKLAQGAGKWVQGAVGKAGGWAGRKTYEKTVGRAMGSEKVKGWTEKLASSKFIGARLLGTGLNRFGMKSEALVQSQYKDLAKGMTPERLNNEILASRGAKRAVLLKEAAGRKDIDMEKLAPILNNPEEMGKIHGDLKRAGLNFKDVEKAVGRSFDMMTAKTEQEFTKATDEFVRSLMPKDFAKGQWDGIFKKTDDPEVQNIQAQLAASIAQYNPGAVAKIAPHIKTENFENFSKIIEGQAIIASTYKDKDKNKEEGVRKRAEQALKALDKTLERRAMFGGDESWSPQKTEEV